MWDVGFFAVAAEGDEGRNATAAPTYFSVNIGGVLDHNSSMGAMVDLCISMAIWDFYAVHSDYRTRLVLHRKDAQDELDVASAVFELMKNEEVHSILGPQKLTEDNFLVELGGKAHVPVISFNARSQSLSYPQSPYNIRTTPDDSNQAKALAALCRGFEWHEAVILFEDSDYRTRFISELYNAFQKDTPGLFLLAKNAGMMSEVYAWLTTDGLGNFMNSIDSDVGSMEELNVYGLWAYDTVWALAMAAERVGPVNPALFTVNDGKNVDEFSNLRISQLGRKLLDELHNITFEGLTGEFRLIDRQLKPSLLEIFNVYEKGDRPIVKRPKGWSFPWTGKLRVGVPKKDGFTEFVNVSTDPRTDQTNVTGFSIHIFLSALQQLPFAVDYEFIPFTNASGLSNGTYNVLLHNISGKAFDMVVGDTTILSDRAKYVDFRLPYSESGTVMVVKNKKEKDMWVFVKPFWWDLWLTIFSTCIFIGIVLRILENRAKNNSDSIRPQKQQLGLLFWFPIAVLAFPERNMVVNNWSRFVLVVWLFMAFILMQSYTANLSAMFTVYQLDFSLSDDSSIGCQTDTFVRDFLISRLNISESRIKEYSTIEEYHSAMSKGTKNGGIDAIFDEIPYMKLFLDRYDSDYRISLMDLALSNNVSRIHSMVDPDPSRHSSSEEEVRGSDRYNIDDLSRTGITHESRQSHLNISANDGQANEICKAIPFMKFSCLSKEMMFLLDKPVHE
ncbi:hypothetical protein ACH5RR_003786 [Cinchona calisaya]|uniref:Ionotropic glutamate receptor C-terminal domain-containing protein n=1 Tax=Cinchona calisaya TaxID=153742 RepID=A0ABD3AW14_9GENT